MARHWPDLGGPARTRTSAAPDRFFIAFGGAPRHAHSLKERLLRLNSRNPENG